MNNYLKTQNKQRHILYDYSVYGKKISNIYSLGQKIKLVTYKIVQV